MRPARSNPGWIILGSIGLLIWVTIIITAFFWVNKPFTLPFARAAGGTVIDLATMLAFVMVAGGLGRWILERFDLPDWSPLERIAAAGLIGLGVLSPMILLVGVVALNTISMVALLVLVVLVTRHDFRSWVQEAVTWFVSAFRFCPDSWQRFLTVMICVMVVLALMLAVLPPVKWDVLTYHLAGAEDYVERGRFYANMDNHFLGFPQGVDALYAAQLAISGRLTSSGPLHWAMGVLTIMMVGGFAGRRFGINAGLAAVATLLVGKSIWLEMTFAYADLMPMGLAIVGIAIVDQQRCGQQTDVTPSTGLQDSSTTILGIPLRWLAWSMLLGAVAGLAMGTKYTVLWLGVAFGVLTLLTSWRGSWRRRILSFAAYGLAAVLALAPWLVRNWVWYGSPVYPLAFPVAEMDAIRQEWYQQTGSGLLYTKDAWQIPILPIAATVLGVDGAGAFAHDIGPLFLVLASVAIVSWPMLARREQTALIPSIVFVSVIIVIWVVTAAFVSHLNQRTRFIFYVFPPLAVVAGAGLESLRRWPTEWLNLGFVVRGAVAVTITLTAVNYVQTVNRAGLWHYYSGKNSYQEDYLYHGLGWHYEAMRQINNLPEGSAVRFLWEPRYLYCDRKWIKCRSDSLLDAWYHARRTANDDDPREIAQRWKAEGIDFLLVYEFGRLWEQERNAFYRADDWEAWSLFVSQNLVEVWRGQMSDDDVQYVIYQWGE